MSDRLVELREKLSTALRSVGLVLVLIGCILRARLHSYLRHANRRHAGNPLHPVRHAATGVRNVNREHHENLSLNDHIALFISDHVGTMFFCYFLGSLMLLWALSQMVVMPALHLPAFDPYPFPFLFFVLGGIMQSLLMPLIMVAQNLSSRHAEARAENDFEVNQRSLALLQAQNDRIEKLEEQVVDLAQINQRQLSILLALFTQLTPASSASSPQQTGDSPS